MARCACRRTAFDAERFKTRRSAGAIRTGDRDCNESFLMLAPTRVSVAEGKVCRTARRVSAAGSAPHVAQELDHVVERQPVAPRIDAKPAVGRRVARQLVYLGAKRSVVKPVEVVAERERPRLQGIPSSSDHPLEEWNLVVGQKRSKPAHDRCRIARCPVRRQPRARASFEAERDQIFGAGCQGRVSRSRRGSQHDAVDVDEEVAAHDPQGTTLRSLEQKPAGYHRTY